MDERGHPGTPALNSQILAHFSSMIFCVQ